MTTGMVAIKYLAWEKGRENESNKLVNVALAKIGGCKKVNSAYASQVELANMAVKISKKFSG